MISAPAKRAVVEDYPALKVHDLPEYIWRRPPHGEREVELVIHCGRDRRRILVTLVTSEQKLGGRRCWYRCPVCFARRGRLLVINESLACRGCTGLPFRSQSASR